MAFRLSREGNYFVVLNTDNSQPDKYPGSVHVDISDNNQDANTVYTLRWNDGDNNRVIAKGVFADYQDSTGAAYVSNGALENFIDNNGHYTPSQGADGTVVDFNDNIKDVFGNPVFVQPRTLFEINHIDSDQDSLEDEISGVNGSTVTRNANRSALEMAVTATTGSRAVRQLHGYYSYQPGKAIQCFYTGVPLDTDTGDIRVRIGSFDEASDKSVGVLDGNGVFFQYNETIGDGWSVVIRSFTSGSQIDTKISQANWSEDTVDGSKDENNPSGFNLDVTDKTIFFIQYGLGLAPVIFGINDPVLGKIVLHKETHQSVSQNMYMSRASLPYRYEIEQLGSTSGGTLSKFCTSVDSLGRHNPIGYGFTADRVENTISVSTAYVPVVSVRLKSGFNRRQVLIDAVALASTTSGNVKFMVVLNPVLDAPSWVDVGNTDSGMEYDITSTSYTGGTQIPPTGYISNNNSQGLVKLNGVTRISSDIQGNSDIVSLVAVKIGGGGAETVTGAINGDTII